MRSPPRVTGPLMARKICKYPEIIKAHSGITVLARAFISGAGDENRTRTFSLGIRPIQAPDRPDLGSRCTVSDRYGLYGTMAIGPLMARPRPVRASARTRHTQALRRPSHQIVSVKCRAPARARRSRMAVATVRQPEHVRGQMRGLDLEFPVACLDATGRGCNVRAAHLEQGMARSDRGG